MNSCFLCKAALWNFAEFCPSCAQEISKMFFAPQNGPRRMSGLRVFSAGPYEGKLRDYLLKLKSTGDIKLQSQKFLAEILLNWTELLRTLNCDSICVVPSNPLREWLALSVARLIGLQLSQNLRIPLLYPGARKNWCSHLLQGSQKGKDQFERWLKPPHFELSRFNNLRGGRLLLVDDLCSSGASLETLAQLLRNRGFKVHAAFTLLENSLKNDS